MFCREWTQLDSTTGVSVALLHVFATVSVCPLGHPGDAFSKKINTFPQDVFDQSQTESGWLECACVSVGGGGAVTLATQLHILQRLPQRKNVFLQHTITTDYRLPSLHQKLSPEKKKHCAFVCVCRYAQTDRDKERWEMIIAHTKNHNWKKIWGSWRIYGTHLDLKVILSFRGK